MDGGRPSWVQESETKPAPMPLLVVQAFVNTYEEDSDAETLAGAEGARWLERAGLVDDAAAVREEDLTRLREAREALRALLERGAGDAAGGGPGRDGGHVGDGGRASTVLATVLGDTAYRPAIGPDGTVTLTAPSGGAGAAATALSRLLLVVRDAQRDGSWQRLKVCADQACRWAYYDRSHARRGRWCDMAGCGNRAKNKALRARRT